MTSYSWLYLPILKWKQGERIALRNLTSNQWDGVVPLIELLGGEPKKVAAEFSTTFPPDQPVGIDVHWLTGSTPRPTRTLANAIAALSKQCPQPLLPSISEAMLLSKHASDLRPLTEREAILRLNAGSISPGDITTLVGAAMGVGFKKSALHLVLDLYSIANEDEGTIATNSKPYLVAAQGTGCASVTLAGGSFPVNLIGKKQGQHDLPRVEWLAYRRLFAGGVHVRYSDYTVTKPGPLADLDPKQVNPSVAIRYACDQFWRLYKAGGFKKGAPDQYRNLCKLLISDTVYTGAGFSYGDHMYSEAAAGTAGNGNPSSWRRDATNHHLVFATKQLQKLFAGRAHP